jgi:hypothetical protein
VTQYLRDKRSCIGRTLYLCRLGFLVRSLGYGRVRTVRNGGSRFLPGGVEYRRGCVGYRVVRGWEEWEEYETWRL